MKKFISALTFGAVVILFAGCSQEGQGSLNSDSSYSSLIEESSSSLESSSDAVESSSEVVDSSEESKEEASSNAEVSSSTSSSQPSESEGIHISECKVPAWGVNDKENIFEMGSEYETYRVIQKAEFVDGALKEIKVQVYVIAEGFDMDAFKAKWGFEPVWNGSYYEGTQVVSEEYEGKTVEEIKLAIAEPILKKYGSETYDGFPEIVMVDPTTQPDPAIEF